VLIVNCFAKYFLAFPSVKTYHAFYL